MRLAYDAQADALSLVFRDGTVETSREIAHGMILNLDPQGDAVSLDLLRARARFGKRGLSLIMIDLHDL